MSSWGRVLMRSRRAVLAVCGGVVLAVLFGGLVLPSESLAEPTCTDNWTNGAGTEAWSVAENWSAGVPGSSDVVCIGSGMTVHVSGSATAGSVQGEGAVALSSGGLELSSTSNVSEITSLSLTGGTLTVAGELKVAGSFSSSGTATVSGAGRLVVESGATGTIDSAACSLLVLSGVRFVNEGTVTLGASGGQTGQLDMQSGAQLQNAGTFNADSYQDNCVAGSNSAAIQNNGGSPSVSNTGTFNVDDGSHTAIVSVPFSNQGTVHVQTGALAPTGGNASTSGGTWTTASGTAVSFSTGEYTLTEADASGAKFLLSGGTLNVASGTSSLGTFVQSNSSALSISGELDVSSFSSSGSPTISGSGRFVLPSGATGEVGSAACSLLTLSGVTFVNEGTVTLGVSGGQAGQLDMQSGAQLQNAGTFNADSYQNSCVAGSNSAAIQNNGGSPSVGNSGTFNVDDGSNIAVVSVPFGNQGAVHVQTGAMQLSGGGSEEGGSWSTSSGTTLSWTGGSFSLTGDTWSGSGTIAVAGATVTATHLTASGATVVVSGGSLTVPEGSTTGVSALSLSGGTLAVAGELKVTGSFASSGTATVSGAGRLVVESGATGAIDSAACSLLTLSGVTLVNEGTLTLGASGGQSGQLDMQSGAQLQNAGTFSADSYQDSCIAGSNAAAIQNNGGSPSASNTGTFNVDDGSHTAIVSVPFSNQGTVHVQSGTLAPTGGNASTSGGTWTTASGKSVNFSTGEYTLTEANASGAKFLLSGGTLDIASGTSTVGTFVQSGSSTLNISGELDVSSFSSSGSPTISGSGRFVLPSGATGAVDSAECSLLVMSGVTFVNEGTVTLGASGGQTGQLDMQSGAQLQNAGTFNADSYQNSCVAGSNAAAIQSNGGSPAFSNTGTFNVDDGSHTAIVSVPFSNQGTVHVQSGVLAPTGGNASTSGGTWTTASGTSVGFGGTYTLTEADAAGAAFSLSGATLDIGSGASSLGALTLTSSSTLDVSGELDVSGSFSSSGSPTIDGSGRLVLTSGARGVVDSAECSLLVLSGVTFVNEGTVTLGASGGQAGQLDMQSGAQLQNAGTFNVDSYQNSCVAGSNSAAIQNNGGSPAISNTGTFNVDDGSHTAIVSVPFSNQGLVFVQGGAVQFSGGGVSGEPSHGDWLAVGGPIELTGGTFIVVDGSVLEARITAATVVWVRASLTGGLSTLHPSVSGTVTVAGKGESAFDGSFTDATIEVAPGGSSTWTTLCGPLTPETSGAFSCSWATAGGGFSDGTYKLRTKLEGEALLAETVTTPTMTVVVDNTPPSGSLTAPSTHGVRGAATITGSASDGGSGVASWQLEIAHEGSSEWGNACAVQTGALSGSEYGCTVTTGSHENGAYELRALITDHAGNTYTTSTVHLHVDNTTPSGTLVAPAAFDSGTVELEGTGTSSGPSVASWVVQIAPAGSYSWSNACPEQTTPVSGTTYRCSMNTTSVSDGVYSLRALVTDEEGNVYTTEPVTVTVDNTAPVGSLYAPPHHVTGTFEAQGYASDAGSGIAGWTLQRAPAGSETWSEACLEQSLPIYGAVFGCEVDAGELENGEYQLRAVIVDNAGNSFTTAAVSFTVENATPTNTTVPVVAGYAIAGRTLSASTGSWTGATPVAYAYQWQQCNSSGESCSNIEEATSSTYTVASGDIGHTLRVQVTASNAAGSTTASSTATAVVLADTLGDLSLPAIGGSADVGSTLHADPGSWRGVAPISYGYQWQHCNSSAAECADIAGATSASYTPASEALGGTLKVVVTATNSEGSTSATSPASAVIAAGSGSSIRYVYDQAGRLSAVDDPAEGAAVYHWDADGNLTGIERVSTSTFEEGFFGMALRRLSPLAHNPAIKTTAPTHRAPTKASAGSAGTTAAFRPSQAPAWDPTAVNRHDGDWFTGRPASPWAGLPGLSAPRSKTGLSGQVLLANGVPLAKVTLALEGSTLKVRTDRTGRFLLSGVPAGHQVLLIDGSSADRRGERYGQFSAGVDLVKGKTTALGYTVWMTPLDRAGNETIPATLKHETVLTNPHIPGLEVRMPAGTSVRDESGRVVRHLNMTAIALDRTPFPLPLFVTGIPTYFTVQPGGAYLSKGARIVYPNWGHLPPGQRVDFWNYDPDVKGWYVYGKGSVSANGKQVVPDPGVRIWEFTGAMISSSGEPPESGPLNGESTTAGDPVDLYTGLFVYQHTDLQVPDSLMPVALTRVYRPRDSTSYDFGIGTQSAFDLHLWSNQNYSKAYLVLPDGAKIKFERTSAGTGYVEAEYAARETSGPWEGATLRWDTGTSGWVLRRREGMKFGFGIYTPLQWIENRSGNRITIVREGSPSGPIVEIRTPHNRGIDLTYDSYHRIVQATDSAGQTVRYEYDSGGRLIQVVDPKGHVTRYAYDDSLGDMTSITDARGNVLISNHYKDGLVQSQTIGGVGTYTFKYGYESCGTGGLIIRCDNIPTQVTTPTGQHRSYAFAGAEGTLYDVLQRPGERSGKNSTPKPRRGSAAASRATATATSRASPKKAKRTQKAGGTFEAKSTTPVE